MRASLVAGAAWIIADAELEEVDALVGTLPLLIKHGVPDMVGAYIAILGVSDRNAILHLSEQFSRTGETASMETISEWLDELDLDAAFPTSEHFLRSALLRRQSFGLVTQQIPYAFASYIATANLEAGTRVRLERDGSDLYLRIGESRVGRVTDETKVNLAPLLKRHNDNVFAVTTSPLSRRSVGVVAVIPL